MWVKMRVKVLVKTVLKCLLNCNPERRQPQHEEQPRPLQPATSPAPTEAAAAAAEGDDDDGRRQQRETQNCGRTRFNILHGLQGDHCGRALGLG